MQFLPPYVYEKNVFRTNPFLCTINSPFSSPPATNVLKRRSPIPVTIERCSDSRGLVADGSLKGRIGDCGGLSTGILQVSQRAGPLDVGLPWLSWCWCGRRCVLRTIRTIDPQALLDRLTGAGVSVCTTTPYWPLLLALKMGARSLFRTQLCEWTLRARTAVSATSSARLAPTLVVFKVRPTSPVAPALWANRFETISMWGAELLAILLLGRGEIVQSERIEAF